MAPDFPTPDMELTHILVVGDLDRFRDPDGHLLEISQAKPG